MMISCAQIVSKQAYIVKIRNIWLYFSYNTLVCIKHNRYKDTPIIYETSTYHSSTTTRHITKFHSEYSREVSSKDIHKVDNIEQLVNQLLFESTRDMVISQITD